MPDKSLLRVELNRKLLHAASAITPAVYAFAPRGVILLLLGCCVAIAVVVEVGRRRSTAFQTWFQTGVGFMVRRREWQRITGATYVLVASWLAVWLFPKSIAIAALLTLAFADTAAALIGMRFGGRLRIGDKSLAGSAACFLSAAVILWLMFPDEPAAVVIGAAVATLAEALPAPRLGIFELNDNLTIPLATGGVLWLLIA